MGRSSQNSPLCLPGEHAHRNSGVQQAHVSRRHLRQVQKTAGGVSERRAAHRRHQPTAPPPPDYSSIRHVRDGNWLQICRIRFISPSQTELADRSRLWRLPHSKHTHTHLPAHLFLQLKKISPEKIQSNFRQMSSHLLAFPASMLEPRRRFQWRFFFFFWMKIIYLNQWQMGISSHTGNTRQGILARLACCFICDDFLRHARADRTCMRRRQHCSCGHLGSHLY